MRMPKCWPFPSTVGYENNACNHAHGIPCLWCLTSGKWYTNFEDVPTDDLIGCCWVFDPYQANYFLSLVVIYRRQQAPSCCKHQLAPTKAARKTASATGGIMKPNKDCPGAIALREICHNQKTSEHLICKVPFRCLARGWDCPSGFQVWRSLPTTICSPCPAG